jgi:predicted O-linked N-acetylglucosamine transferase (SPINDLY family)
MPPNSVHGRRQVFGWDERHRKAVALAEAGDAAEALIELRRVMRENPDDAAADSYRLFLEHYRVEDPIALHHDHLGWALRHAKVQKNTRFPARGKQLRIGYVSPHFRQCHPVLSFIEPVLRAHDRRRVHVTCYSDAPISDASGRARLLADQWREIAGEDDRTVADLVRSDKIDILVDLAGHLAGNRLLLFATTPAPVQVTWLGYPNGTGLSTIGYRLTDSIADPPGLSDQLHCEKLSRLEGGFLCYQPPQPAMPVSALPAWFCGHITFGCFQYPGKITSEAIRCWAQVLLRVPHARLLFHHCFSDYSSPQSRYRDRIAGEFAKEGIDSTRLSFVGGLGEDQHFDLYGKVDLMLDTFPYNGTSTTCEALWMGVPVISMSGISHVGRVGSSILNRVGLGDLVATTPDGYIDICASTAQDVNLLAGLRGSLRGRFQECSLFRADVFTSELEDQLAAMTAG